MPARISTIGPFHSATLLAAALCAGCGGGARQTAPVYAPAPTRADVSGPVVPPVYLRLVAEDGTLLERATDGDWSEVCFSPCDGYVPAFGNYRVTVRDNEPSLPFTLPGPPGTWVKLKVANDGRVWTLDSVQLAAQRARKAAAGAAWLGLFGFLRR